MTASKLPDAYMAGRQHACDELTAALTQGAANG